MTRTPSDGSEPWEDIGRAAERFARRVARDAGKFAERLQEHAGDLADEVSRGWRRGHGDRGRERACGHRRPPDVRGMFEDVRGILGDIVEGMDELIGRVFPDRPEAAGGTWERRAVERDVTCGECGRTVTAGAEAYVRRTREGQAVRCLECGTPSADPEPPA
jgi:hypothetical protein